MNILEKAKAKRDALRAEAAELDTFIRTYESVEASLSGVTATRPTGAKRGMRAGSAAAKTAELVTAILTAAGGEPVPTADIHAKLVEMGEGMPGDQPLNVLSARLNRAGFSAIRGKGWLLPEPDTAGEAEGEQAEGTEGEQAEGTEGEQAEPTQAEAAAAPAGKRRKAAAAESEIDPLAAA